MRDITVSDNSAEVGGGGIHYLYTGRHQGIHWLCSYEMEHHAYTAKVQNPRPQGTSDRRRQQGAAGDGRGALPAHSRPELRVGRRSASEICRLSIGLGAVG